MKRGVVILVLVALGLLVGGGALAASLKVQVGEFTVTGAANKEELKGALPALLATRLSGDGVTAVEGAADVAALVTGSYAAFGSTFSIDAVVKSPAGEVLGRSFVQGKAPDDLIPAVGKLAVQLRPIVLGSSPGAGRAAPSAAAAVLAPPAAQMDALTPVVPAAGTAAVAAAAVIPKGEVVPPTVGDIVRVAPATVPVTQQQRIEGALLGIAPGRVRSGGERELVLADSKHAYLYLQGQGVKKVAEYAIRGEGKILGVDTADADGDGQPEAYLTVMDREELVSVALALTDQGFAVIAERLPYYFRAIAGGGGRRLYAQQISSSDDFFGPVSEVVKKGSSYALGAALKLPPYANIFTFNRVKAADGSMLTVVIDRDGNLRVLDAAGKELWQGSDRFGGSEIYFLRDEQQMQPLALDRYRWRFLEQRLTATPSGEIIVPRNGGLMVIGNNRSYSKNNLVAFAWNGATLEERWHTKESANYLADYFYDAERKELVLLEQVQKEGLFSRGASTIVVKKVE